MSMPVYGRVPLKSIGESTMPAGRGLQVVSWFSFIHLAVDISIKKKKQLA